MNTLKLLNEAIAEVMEAYESKEVTEYNRIKDWDTKALAGYARKIGVDNEAVDSQKRDREMLIEEIMGHLFGEDFMTVLMKHKAV